MDHMDRHVERIGGIVTSHERSPARSLARSLRARWRSIGVPALATLVVLATVGGTSAERPEPRRTYIVTLAVADAGKAFDPAGRRGRERIRRRAMRTSGATDRLEADFDFQARHRYESALSGFSARLSRSQAARIARDPQVATVRRARRVRLASQVVPAGIKRVRAIPTSPPGPDVDADIAVIDTGIGPVGGGELNIAGGVNCSGDGLPAEAYGDLYP